MRNYIFSFILVIIKYRNSFEYLYFASLNTMSISWSFLFTSLASFLPFLLDALRFYIFSLLLFIYSNGAQRKAKYINYLKIGMIINCLMIIVFFFIPVPTLLNYPYSQSDLSIFNFYMITTSNIFNFIFLITNGVLILLIGMKNKDLNGSYLQYAGIFLILYFFIRILLINPLGYYTSVFTQLLLINGQINQCQFIVYTTLLGPLHSLPNLVGIFCLIFHGLKNKEIYFTLAGLSYIIIYLFIGYGQIPQILTGPICP